MSGAHADTVEVIAGEFESLVRSNVLPQARVIRRPWDDDSVRLDWIEPNDLRKNIYAHIGPTHIEFEGHAWKDLVQHDDVVRYWEPFEAIETVPNMGPPRRGLVEDATEEAYQQLMSVQGMQDLDKRTSLDLDEGERQVTGLQ